MLFDISHQETKYEQGYNEGYHCTYQQAGKLKVIAVNGAKRAALLPDVPIVAEEAVARGDVPDVETGRFFLVDPLDGTKEFVNRNGEFTVKGTDKKVTFGQVALTAYVPHNYPLDKLEPGLNETAFYDPTNFTFPAGAYICELEVDPGTGKTSFVNFVAADDFGRLINPMIVEGQVHGGLAQGIGQALLEGAVYDDTGQLVTASFMDYTMPRADDLPSFQLSHTTTLCPGNPLGVKGCGEAGAIGASAAVINAITDAIGNNKLEMPATPDRVWHAIHG